MNDQELWDLLGQARRPPAPPFFATKVMRQIDANAAKAPWMTLLQRWLAPAAVAALVLLAVHAQQSPTPVATGELTTLDLVELLSPEDYETLTNAGWPYNNGFLSVSL
jgi:hypothetical protein